MAQSGLTLSDVAAFFTRSPVDRVRRSVILAPEDPNSAGGKRVLDLPAKARLIGIFRADGDLGGACRGRGPPRLIPRAGLRGCPRIANNQRPRRRLNQTRRDTSSSNNLSEKSTLSETSDLALGQTSTHTSGASFAATRAMRTTALLIGLTLAVSAVPRDARANKVGIAGAGNGCNLVTIGAAIAAAGANDTLYLKSGQNFPESVVIDFDLTLEAGNNNCSGSAAANAVHPVIEGNGIRLPLRVSNGANVTLERVESRARHRRQRRQRTRRLRNARLIDSKIYLGVATNGAGVFIFSSGSVTMRGTSAIYGNVTTGSPASGMGGGVYVAGELELFDDTSIGIPFIGNFAGRGGGVYVASTGAATFHEDSAILANEATWDGGGAYTAGEFDMWGGRIGGVGGGEDNEANFGGGIFATDGASVVLDVAEVAYNTANVGGGAYVEGEGTDFYAFRTAKIHHNNAPGGWGGGVAFEGTGLRQIDGEVSDNVAATEGGGISVVDGALVLFGAYISRNEGWEGGGLYVAGASSVVSTGTWFHDNTAVPLGGSPGVGGGIMVRSSAGNIANLSIRGLSGLEGCDGRGFVGMDQYCSEIRGNSADGGGGLLVYGGLVDIHQTAFIANEATIDGSGIFISADAGNTPSTITYTNGLIVEHVGVGMDVISVGGAQTFQGNHLTIAENDGTAAHYYGTASGHLRRSIVWHSGDVLVDAPLQLLAACTMFETVVGTTTGVNRVFGLDPLFAVTARGHYRLLPLAVSPSVDECQPPGTGVDLDGWARPAGALLLWDRGAFEAP